MPPQTGPDTTPTDTPTTAETPPATRTEAGGDLAQLVRVKTATGAETYCSRGHALASDDLTIIDEPAVPNASYDDMTVEDLKTESSIRNHRAPAGSTPITASGNKADLVAALAGHDQAVLDAARAAGAATQTGD